MKLPIKLTAALIISFSLFSCGGGGGGGQNSGNPASVSIQVSPDVIDTGDRTNVKIRLDNIKKDGVPALLIKVLHPSALFFHGDTATLSRNNLDDAEIIPILASADESNYTVFYITRPTFGTDNTSATLSFQLEAFLSVKNGEVSVDVDIVDTDTRPLFTVTNPKFLALATTSIRVLED